MSKEKMLEIVNGQQYLEGFYADMQYYGTTFEINNGKVTDYHENDN